MASCRLAACSPGFQQLSIINVHASEQQQAPAIKPRCAARSGDNTLQGDVQGLQKGLHLSLAAEIVICKVNPCKQSCK
jgi:hypothetical protein